jgi:hypothetical protein
MQQKIKKVVIGILACFCIIPSVAQETTDEKKKEINVIKKSADYIYAEATMADQQAAMDLAKEILYNNVNEWVAKQKKFAGSDKVVTANTNYTIEDVTLPRGNWFRAFMYVRKKDIIPVENATVSEVVNQDTEQTAKPVEPNIPGLEDPQMEKQFLAVENTEQLSTLLKQLKTEGKIIEFNKYNSLNNPNEYVVFVFSKEGKICAVLSQGPERINLKTKQPDQVTNYKGNGAIGVKIK